MKLDAAVQNSRSNLPAAVALMYREQGGTPRVGAKGSGLIAEEIIRRAHEAGIFVHESREMVSLLMQVDLDQHIPPQLYAAIAELLAWIYRLESTSGTISAKAAS